MRSKLLFLAAIAMLVMPQTASAQYYDQYGRRYYDNGYRQPPPAPPGYYEERRYYRERPPERYREREVYRRPHGAGGIFCAREGGYCAFQGPAVVRSERVGDSCPGARSTASPATTACSAIRSSVPTRPASSIETRRLCRNGSPGQELTSIRGAIALRWMILPQADDAVGQSCQVA